jgi:hypothetical protein
VDLVVYGPGVFAAIEVKNSRDVHGRDLRGLKAFRGDFPEARLLLLYRGDERLVRDGILCLPAETFLRGLKPSRNLPSK